MAENAFTKTTTTGFGQRIGSSFKGVIMGLILIVGGTALLWWNEGNFVATGDAISELGVNTVNVSDISTIDSSLNGKPIHATGMADTQDTLTDRVFGISAVAIKLNRTVQYYQWVEHSKTETRQKLGGGEEKVTTYSYEKEWVSAPVESSKFEYPSRAQNTVLITIADEKLLADKVTFGAYTLPTFLKSAISGEVPVEVELTDTKIAELNGQIDPKLRSSQQQATQEDEDMSSALVGFGRDSEDTPGTTQYVHVSGNSIYLGAAPNSPQIGDARVTITKVKPAQISIIAKVNGGTFEKYVAQNGMEIFEFAMGAKSTENMISSAHESNSMMTWILRIVGIILIIVGIKTILAPLAVLASVLPILGDIVGMGTGIVSFVVGFAWSLVIIAIAWLRFRPVIGIIILLVAVAMTVFLVMRGRKKKAAAAAATPVV